ncbi:MAG TPA: hypothetical protein VII11_02405 [Bacteroidota bacterium]
MVRRTVLGMTATCVAVVLVVLAGCEPFTALNDNALSTEDAAALKQMILSDPLFTSDPAVLNDGDAPSFSYTLGKTTTPILPLHWGRRITSVSRDVVFDQPNDTTVIATLTHTFEGSVFIVAQYSTSDSARTVIQKPLNEEIVRKIKFYRKERSNTAAHRDSSHKGWKPAEVSASKGGTLNSQVVINKMEVTTGDETITITDPTNYFFELGNSGWHLGRPMIVNIGLRRQIAVRVTLTSADADTDWVSVHRPLMVIAARLDVIKPIQERMKLVSQTQVGSSYERVYEASWNSMPVGRAAFFVTALTRSSLYDDQAAFSSQVWGVPYITE